jgi:MFS family permease
MNSTEAQSDGAVTGSLTESASNSPDDKLGDKRLIGHLLWFFALVYIVEGLGQVVGLISQPLTYYLKQVHGWTPVQVTAYLALFNLPWIIKPVYGLISDFVPLFGYRRKSYLLIVNVAAVCGFIWASQLTAPGELVFALSVTAYAMAISSTLCGAVLVENGQKLHESATFVNQQWLWFNIAGIVAAILGGQLVQRLPPTTALHVASMLLAFAPFAVIAGALLLIPERRVTINVQGLKDTLAGLVASFKRSELWLISGFLFLYNFSPGIGTPLYYHMTDTLKFSQGYIGILNSISSAGWVIGALLYRVLFKDLTLKALLNLSIGFGAVAVASFLLLSSEVSAAIIYFANGFAQMLAMVATLTLAADYCPPRAEGFAFAVLMSISNLASSLADIVGSYFYTHLLGGRLPPLVIISSAFTVLAFVLVPLLRLGDKPQGQPPSPGERPRSTSP